MIELTGLCHTCVKTTYDYDATGIRTSALQEIDTDADLTWDSRTLTAFLVDHQNHTGYEQVVRGNALRCGLRPRHKTVDYSSRPR
ncbi:MAG: hypothetical protein R3C02_23135 [Planctomycetaceae bacterium]